MKTAVGVLALAGLAVGVVLLWPTAVPNDLVLGDIDESAVFGAELVERAERYERFLYVLWVLSQIALLATLWIYARKGAAYTKESAAGPIGTGMLLGMLGLAIVWLSSTCRSGWSATGGRCATTSRTRTTSPGCSRTGRCSVRSSCPSASRS